ncbi:hypothetical protein B0H19DRAFT_1241082 [Mycena capillaripes]|nr:hypothetical protein B0H19DRAFT_1241082 [Mycena capillaripes]
MIPQELIDTIVNEVDPSDKKSLKACSETALALRDSSQRILFRSFTLKCGGAEMGPNYSSARARVTESPRIAGYITRLNIILPVTSVTDSTVVEDFRQVLGKVPNVRRCDIVGKHGGIPWYEYVPGLEEAIIQFLWHQTLGEVYISRLNLRSHLIALLVARVPTLTLDGIRVNNSKDTASTPLHFDLFTTHPRILQTDSDDVCNFLCRPEVAAYSTDLACLVIPLYPGHVTPLLAITASNLEHVRFHCSGPMPQAVSPLPAFPLLRSIGLTLAFMVLNIPWILQVLSSSIEASDRVEEVMIAYLPIRWENLDELKSDVMASLDEMLSCHPTVQRIRWRFDLHRVELPDGIQSLPEVERYLQKGMPTMHEQGRLVVEEYSYATEREEWRANFPNSVSMLEVYTGVV